MALVVSVSLAGLVEKEQVAATKAELSASAAEGILVLVTVLFVAAAVEVEVIVGVEVTVFVTLMINHRRESLSICMIKPAGFLMTKLPR